MRLPILSIVGAALITAATAAEDRPNVIIVLVDDLGYADIGCYGSTWYETPNIDRLAEGGVRFTDGYAACAVCSPTRAALLTGRYPTRIGITDWIRPLDGKNWDEATVRSRPGRNAGGDRPLIAPTNPSWMEHDEITIAEILRERGYATGFIGKWHLGPAGFYPEDQGFDFNAGGCSYGHPPNYFDPYPATSQRATFPNLPPRREGEYLTDREADEAVGFIRDHADEPFFLHLCHYAVHSPIQAKQDLVERYDAKPRVEGDGQDHAPYAAMVHSVDDAMGRIVEALRELDLEDDTIVIFTSDNGGATHFPATENRPLRSGKGRPYEGGIRVPLIVSWPGHVPAGEERADPACSIDLLPTICAATGCDVPTDRVIDGVDLMPALAQGNASMPRPLYWHFPHYWWGGRLTPYSVVRYGRWKLVRWYETGVSELYDLDADISESNDLHDTRPETVDLLAAMLDRWLDDTNGRMPVPRETWVRQRESVERAAAVRPDERQTAWQDLEFTCFVHFGVNTFTGREWGTGTEDPALFNPIDFDANQWVESAQSAGMSLMLLTVKHHDGFCLWPSDHTEHDVANASWRGGTGDVVGEVARACAARGMRLGIYLSPADLYEIEREDGFYGNGSVAIPSRIGTGEPVFEYTVDDYNRYFLNQLHELLTRYGPVHEVWFDGANPKPGTGQTYDYAAWYDLIRRLAPDAVIAIKGPDVRWCGNEAGSTRPAEWSVIPIGGAPDDWTWPDMTAADLGSRARIETVLADGGHLHWYPAEVNTSIRHGWFWRDERQHVKPASEILDIWYRAVGGNSVFLLNVPPDRRGRFADRDVAVLREVGAMLRGTFDRNLATGATVRATGRRDRFDAGHLVDGEVLTGWATGDWYESGHVVLDLPETRRFNRVVLQEMVQEFGQRIERFAVDAWLDDAWREIATGTTVGSKRICRFPTIETKRVRVRIQDARVCPSLAEVGLYLEPVTVTRD